MKPGDRNPGCKMPRPRKATIIMLCNATMMMLYMLVVEGISFGQKAPSVPDHPWDDSSAKQKLTPPPRPLPPRGIDTSKIYTLAELVNIAEKNNPDTRVAWESAKSKAADLGIAKSTLYPTLAAAVTASSIQADLFFGTSFQQQTLETISPGFHTGLHHL